MKTRCVASIVVAVGLLAGLQVVGEEASEAIDLDSCVFQMRLVDGAGKGTPLVVHGRMAKGQCVTAFALTPGRGTAVHSVQMSALTFASGNIMGPLPITVQPDTTTGGDLTPFPAFYMLDATVGQAGFKGTYMGSYGAEQVSGAIDGKVATSVAAPASGTVVFTMDKAFSGGEGKQNWARVACTYKDGVLVSGRVRNGEGDIKGAVVSGTVGWEREQVKATLVVEVPEGRGVSAGRYIFECTGLPAGEFAAGAFEVFMAQEPMTRRGRFLAELQTRRRVMLGR